MASALNHHRYLADCPYVHIHCSFEVAGPGAGDSGEEAFEDDRMLRPVEEQPAAG